jgi:multidrug transporter EmrE-like cation transporter
MKVFFQTWGLIILSAFLDSYAAYIVKVQFNKLGAMDLSSVRSIASYLWQFVQHPILLSAIIAFVMAPGLWFLALNRMDLSVGYPALVGFHLIFILVFGLCFLGEAMTMNKAIGTSLIFVSLYFLYKQ